MVLTGIDSVDIIELLNFFLDTLKFAYPILLILIPIPIIRYICKRIKKYSECKGAKIRLNLEHYIEIFKDFVGRFEEYYGNKKYHHSCF